MRRKDREVADFDRLVDIIGQCHVLRLGLADGDFPYIVPVNFGYTVRGREVRFYIHGAMAGRKYELLLNNPYCSFEMDVPVKLDCVKESRSVTMRYRSLMGRAKARLLEGAEKERAMDGAIMARYEETRSFNYNRAAVAHTAVWELTVLEMTGKENPIR